MQILNAMLRLCLPYTNFIHTNKGSDSDGEKQANETRCKCTKTKTESRTLIFASPSITAEFHPQIFCRIFCAERHIDKKKREKLCETETETRTTKPNDMICIVEELCLRSMPFYYIKRTRLRIIMLIHFHIHNDGFGTHICGLLVPKFPITQHYCNRFMQIRIELSEIY